MPWHIESVGSVFNVTCAYVKASYLLYYQQVVVMTAVYISNGKYLYIIYLFITSLIYVAYFT